ncbi:MAG: Galactose-1-phosphate uridylyltransferase [Candidatus Azambacteria bacterium GW2011_GWA2_39_10]|uniref:Galactose-1-phosphate uridylyltransferase n=1 Tax=Candidatus Azambacteria bacterium GW2011_GWA2_39_10 TaxID=1618611 RepID=A0A0G0LGY6_9BACT|nr:MAG: Galactose-1-phosphate uridylyltransferase [Candidatus Azambacteria bacterium GW2011_GWA2_39_10]
MKKNNVKSISELRQDPVSGDWMLLAPLRGKRHKFKRRIKVELSKNKCPFDNLAQFGNLPPVLVYRNKDDWFLQVIPNKYPAVGHGECSLIFKNGVYKSRPGVGFHEIVILRDHDRYLVQYSVLEIKKILMAYRERYLSLAKDKCVKYISIFHNHGKEAGSTVPHLHSQILALPIVPPDVSHSINGSRRYYHEYKKCIHCEMLRQEIKDKKRIIYENYLNPCPTQCCSLYFPEFIKSSKIRHLIYLFILRQAVKIMIITITIGIWKFYLNLKQPAALSWARV